jgi:hypothetical protein
MGHGPREERSGKKKGSNECEKRFRWKLFQAEEEKFLRRVESPMRLLETEEEILENNSRSSQ